jgi:hypothetical protein
VGGGIKSKADPYERQFQAVQRSLASQAKADNSGSASVVSGQADTLKAAADRSAEQLVPMSQGVLNSEIGTSAGGISFTWAVLFEFAKLNFRKACWLDIRYFKKGGCVQAACGCEHLNNNKEALLKQFTKIRSACGTSLDSGWKPTASATAPAAKKAKAKASDKGKAKDLKKKKKAKTAKK